MSAKCPWLWLKSVNHSALLAKLKELERWENISSFLPFSLFSKNSFCSLLSYRVSSHSLCVFNTNIPIWMRTSRKDVQSQLENHWSPNSTSMLHDSLAPALPAPPSACTPSMFQRFPPLKRPLVETHLLPKHPLLIQPQLHGHIIHKPTLPLCSGLPMYQRKVNWLTLMLLSLSPPAEVCHAAKWKTKTTSLVTCTISIPAKHDSRYDFTCYTFWWSISKSTKFVEASF